MSASSLAFAQLGAALVLEPIATSFLAKSEQFTRPLPTIIMALGYLAAFYCLSLSLKVVPVGIAYAIWSALGIVLISIIGFIAFNQRLDAAACAGMGLIVAGVLVIRLFSASVPH